MSNLVDYAKRELDMLEKDESGLQERMNQNILEIIEKFSEQGHSGFTAAYAIGMLIRLLRWKPIKPLTGEPDEWADEPLGGGTDKQNKRCGSVFLNPDGTAEDIDAIIVSDNGGITWYTTNRFRKYITFPYMPPDEPEKIYIEYKEDVPPGYTSDEFDIITDDLERIKRLRERKEKEFEEKENGNH